MLILGRLFLIVPLLLASAIAHAAANPCDMKLLALMDVEIDDWGTVLVPVRIEGHDAWMILDIASDLPWVFRSSVDLLGLMLKPIKGVKMRVGAQPVVNQVKVGHLILGKADFAGWDMYVVPDSGPAPLSYRGRPLIGVLTSGLMQAVDVELNLGAKKINLFSHTSCRGQSVYWGGGYTVVDLITDWTGLMIFPMELEGQRIATSFNTGSRYSRIHSEVAKKFFGFDEKSDHIEKETLDNGGEISSYRAMGLTAKGLSVNNAKIQIVKRLNACKASVSGRASRAIGYTNCMKPTPFSIGTDLLKKLRVYIASREKKIYITRADPAVRPEPSAASAMPAAPVSDAPEQTK